MCREHLDREAVQANRCWKIEVLSVPSLNRVSGRICEVLKKGVVTTAAPFKHSHRSDRLSQSVITHTCIDFRRRNLPMAKRPLHQIEIPGLVVQSRGKCVPK